MTTVVDYLVATGLVEPGVPISVEPLTGGVSSEIVAVTGPGVALAVKRALPQLRVEQEWLADPHRIAGEARALRLAGKLAPGAVPELVHVDEEACVAVLRLAPPDWENWRDLLLAGTIDPEVGRRLGDLLATWHGAALPADAANVESFVQLRIDPFHRVVAERHPELTPRVNAVADRLVRPGSSLVHGDFSPKNVLVGPDALWVLDWEVAHNGQPVFDHAFLLAHLLLKSVHRPGDAPCYRGVAEAFLDGYGAPVDELSVNVGCLLLARVDGKSPAAYLRPGERDEIRRLGSGLLRDPSAEILDVWERLP